MEALRQQSELAAALRAIPRHEKAEFVHVLGVAPQLVDTESEPKAFLRYCNWDATAAARHLTVYWKKRVQVFGEDRAFLPLNDMSGITGALGHDELEILRTGAYCFMPNDIHSRDVLYVNRSLLPPILPHMVGSRLRVHFFLFQQLSRNTLSQTVGFSMVIRGSLTPLTKEGKILNRESLALVRDVFPLRVNDIHAVYIRREGNGLVQSLIPFLLNAFARFFSNKIRIHNCESVQEAVANLSTYGISRESLPQSMGGLVETTDGTNLPQSIPVSVVGRDYRRQEFVDPLSVGTQPSVNNYLPEMDSDFHLLGDDSSIAAGRGTRENDSGPESSMLNPTPIRPPPQNTAPTPNSTDPGEAVDWRDVALEDIPLAETTYTLERGLSALNEAMNRLPPPQNTAPTPNSTDPGEAVDWRDVALEDIPLAETPDTLERGLSALNEAMNRLPDTERVSYKNACQRAPLVVKTESDPLSYLRFEKFDCWAAAKRLALYWKYRVGYFGGRAFLPFAQTMGGALWEEDIYAVASGSFFFLPMDSRGRPVLCFDPKKLPGNASEATLVRVAMYFFSILYCENPIALTEGCVILVFVTSRTTELSRFDGNIREAINVVLDSFPIKSCETHIICSPTSTANPLSSFPAIVLPRLLRAIGRLLIYDQAHFHVRDTRDELEHKLDSFGLPEVCLQVAVNGGISGDDFARWIMNRKLLESQRWSQLQQQPPLCPADEPAVVAAAAGAQAATSSLSKSPSGSRGEAVARVSPQDISKAMESLPMLEKAAYLKAMKEAPELVRKESDPARFLETENQNAVAAARRLAAYWRIRQEIFGERAFLPMNQTAKGALARKDVAVLQTGFLAQLPNAGDGCSVIFCDGSQLEKASRSSLCRAFFYMWSVLSQIDLSQTNGYTLLYLMSSHSFDRSCRECLELVMEAHPVRLSSFHLCGLCPSGTSESDFRQGSVRHTMNWLGCSSLQSNVIIHVCASRAGFAGALSSHGMVRDGLPIALGGGWGLEDFVKWQELRIRAEWNLPIPASAWKLAEKYCVPHVPFCQRLSEDEETQRRRRLNSVHSRNKRLRFQVQTAGLQEQVSALGEEKKKLLQEGRELEELLQQARSLASDESAEETCPRIGGTRDLAAPTEGPTG